MGLYDPGNFIYQNIEYIKIIMYNVHALARVSVGL